MQERFLDQESVQHFSARFPRLAVAGLTTALFLLTIGCAVATTHYVDVNSTNATLPYTNCSTAATNIQDAVGAAAGG